TRPRMPFIEAARLALTRLSSLTNPPWETRRRWRNDLLQNLQERLRFAEANAASAELILDDLWDRMSGVSNPAASLLQAAAEQVSDLEREYQPDAYRRLRSIAPPELLMRIDAWQ